VVVHAYRESERPGKVEVEVKRPNGYLCLLVRDHGCGLAPRTDSPGLGLGLPLIAESASSLEVRTPGEGGTEIRMRFDLRTAAYTAG
jgi:serine/threonine-protein kinase RsbW